ncbi:MAG: hypothetical protein LM574_02665 [Archaeoglobus sp.]|nr:hypothetical protein [Archaeoglobus sp.]
MKLYNDLNFERRQAYICSIDRLCNAQQIIKKNKCHDKQLLELQLHNQKVQEEGRRIRMRRANTGHQADARAVTDKRRLLKCLSCGLEANRDAAGVLNMATSMEVALTGNAEPKRAVNSRPMRALEARISRL